MSDQRKRDISWNVAAQDGSVPTWERVGIAVLMDIRDELKSLNALLNCPNFVAIPSILRKVRANTSKPQAKKK